MKKEMFIISILAVFMLLTISFAAAVGNLRSTENKESPLYRIRTGNAVSEQIKNLGDRIKSRYVGERIFFLPFETLRIKKDTSARNALFVTKGCTVPVMTCSNTQHGCCQVERGYQNLREQLFVTKGCTFPNDCPTWCSNTCGDCPTNAR